MNRFRTTRRRRLVGCGALAVTVAALLAPWAAGDPLPPQIHTVAGAGACAGAMSSGGPCDNVAATSIPINGARAVAALPGGGFLYVDEGNNLVRAVSPAGAVTTVAGNGSAIDAANGALAVASGLNDPVGVAPLAGGGFLITEYAGSVVRMVSPGGRATATITTIAGTGTAGSNGLSGQATSIELNHPTDAEPTADGRVLIADTWNNSIRLLSAAAPGATISTIAGAGTCNDATAGCDGQQAGAVVLDHPVSAAPIQGGAGGYLIAEFDANAVRRVSAIAPEGTFTTVAGTPVMSGYAGDGGAATAALLNHPQQVVSTPDGGYLIADTGNERIRAVSASGTITTLAGNGKASFSGDGGGATSASFQRPSGVAPAPDGGFLVADTDDGAIRAVTIPPATTIALSPATPNGRNGWYVTAVHVTISASRATDTRCTVDLAPAPTVYDLIPGSCPYTGAGADIGAAGTHSIYAASVDATGDKELPITATLKIDATPPVLSCPPALSFPAGARAAITAAVTDQGSGPVSPTVTARAPTGQVGARKVKLTGTDNAGNTATVACGYKVLPLTFDPLPALAWRFSAHRLTSGHGAGAGTPPPSRFGVYNTVERLIVEHVAAKASVTVVCRGDGCPLRSATCRLARCTGTAPGEVDLAPLFKGRRLVVGAQLTVSVTSPNTIGRAWVLTARSRNPPADRVACLAPGFQALGRGC